MKKDTPFSISPTPHLLYLTATLKSVLHKVRYTIEHRRGLTSIIGDVGMGKSSIIRLIYGEYSARTDSHIALITNPNFSTDFGLMKAICAEYGLPPRASMYTQEAELKGWLLKQFAEDKNVIVLIDEAQIMTHKMLERIRTLLNIETDTSKLIQIVLAAQVELKDRLAKPNMKALNSRLFAPSSLDTLTLAETKSMLEFRCEREGEPCPVPNDLFEMIYDTTKGIPREVLKLCDITYELMRLDGSSQFTKELLTEGIGEYKYESKG